MRQYNIIIGSFTSLHLYRRCCDRCGCLCHLSAFQREYMYNDNNDVLFLLSYGVITILFTGRLVIAEKYIKNEMDICQ